jgi:hypothetical protein
MYLFVFKSLLPIESKRACERVFAFNIIVREKKITVKPLSRREATVSACPATWSGPFKRKKPAVENSLQRTGEFRLLTNI